MDELKGRNSVRTKRLLTADGEKAFLEKLQTMKQMEQNRKAHRNALTGSKTREDFFVDNVNREDFDRMIDLSIEALKKRLGG